MNSEEPDELKTTVERTHKCIAHFAQSVPVRESTLGKAVWEGVVHIFKLVGHPKTTRAYAWSTQVPGSAAPRFTIALHIPPVTSPVEAVRAELARERDGIP